jgi:hypothetical protein
MKLVDKLTVAELTHMDFTVMLWAKMITPRLRELMLAREKFIEAVTTDKNDLILEYYFTYYAVTARVSA